MKSLITYITEKLDINDVSLRPDYCDDPALFKKGDILVSIFSYSMTLVSFYKVDMRSGAKTLYLKEVGSKIVEGDGMRGKCVPEEDNIISKETLKVMVSRKDGKLRAGKGLGYRAMYRWNGVPVAFDHMD